MADLKLTPEQLAFFDTFGYLHFPGLLADRIDAIIDAFEAIWADHGGGHHGKPHGGQARSCMVPFIDQHPDLCALLDDPKIHGIACDLLGDDFNYTGSDGNYYAGDTGWHSDSAGGPVTFVKFAFYLDPLTRDTGAIRVIPGSHRFGEGYADAISVGLRDNAWGIDEPAVPALAVETKPGDVVAFNQQLKHASFGGKPRRRMFTINCSQRYAEADLDAFRELIGHMSRFWADRLYGETMVATAGPQRMVHLEQGMANDGHLAALSAQARERMAEPSRG